MTDQNRDTRTNHRYFEVLCLVYKSMHQGLATTVSDIAAQLDKESQRPGCHLSRMGLPALTQGLNRLIERGLVLMTANGKYGLTTRGLSLASRLFGDGKLDVFHQNFIGPGLNYKQMVIQQIISSDPQQNASMDILVEFSGMSEQSVRAGITNLIASGNIELKSDGLYHLIDRSLSWMDDFDSGPAKIEYAPDELKASSAEPVQTIPLSTLEPIMMTPRTILLPQTVWALLDSQAILFRKDIATHLAWLIERQADRMTA